jgi:septal ring factor EnvC (AmiA/AmiB activator)
VKDDNHGAALDALADTEKTLAEVRKYLEKIAEDQTRLEEERAELVEERSAVSATLDTFAREVQSLIDAEAHRRDVVGLPGMTPEQLGEAIMALIPGDGDW